MEGSFFILWWTGKREGGERKRGREYIPKNQPSQLLPLIRPHFLNYPLVGTRYLRQEPVGDISYLTYNIHLHLDPGIQFCLFILFSVFFFFLDKESIEIGTQKGKSKGRRRTNNKTVCHIWKSLNTCRGKGATRGEKHLLSYSAFRVASQIIP